MSGSHKEFPKKAVFVQLGLAALVGAGYLFSDKPAAHASAEAETKPIVTAAAKILAPVGKVEVKEESAGSAARSGEEIYTSTCSACHNTGIAGAPKLDDKASWETRLSGGFAALVASATNGKGGMPARGGNPDISDSEMELVVGHMVKQAGIDLVPRSSGSAPAATEIKPVVAVKTEEAPKVEVAPKVEEVVTKAEVVPKVEEVAAEAEVAPKVEEIGTKAEVIPKVEEVAAKVEETKDAVVEKTSEVAKKVEEVKTDAVATVAATTEATSKVDHSAGEAIYKSSCFACHDSGVAGSPKLGDKEVWAPRIATGTDTLYEAAIKGKGAMPAKGGNTSISDADIKAAVDYMTANSM